jgi:hypothetical protein
MSLHATESVAITSCTMFPEAKSWYSRTEAILLLLGVRTRDVGLVRTNTRGTKWLSHARKQPLQFLLLHLPPSRYRTVVVNLWYAKTTQRVRENILRGYVKLKKKQFCGLGVRVPGCRLTGPGFDSRLYQFSE